MRTTLIGMRGGKTAIVLSHLLRLKASGRNNIVYVQKGEDGEPKILNGCEVVEQLNLFLGNSPAFINYSIISDFPEHIINLTKAADLASQEIKRAFSTINGACKNLDTHLVGCGLSCKKAFSSKVPEIVEDYKKRINNDIKVRQLRALSIRLMERRDKILTEFYETGRIDGLYFGKSARKTNNVTNPVKTYIKQQLTRNNIKDDSLIDDVYNELFVELYKKEAAEICAIYDEAPSKLIATALRIIVLKNFTIDPRYGNPNHSFIQRTMFGSIEGGAVSLNSDEEFSFTQGFNVEYDNPKAIKEVTLVDKSLEPENFCKRYGFNIEELLDRLSPEDLQAFYGILGKQPRGKSSDAKKVSREALFNRIRDIKEALQNE